MRKMNDHRKTTYFYAFDITKIFFVFLVVCYHTSLLDGVINHAYLSVEFFFIISGFLIAKRATNVERKINSVTQYIRDRLNKLYPHYIFSFIVILIVSICMHGTHIIENYNILAEIFMVQSLGLTKGGLNYPCWYISVLFWGSILFYAILLYTTKKVRIFLFTICVVMFYTWVIFFNGGRTVNWGYFYGIYTPLLRGLANMALGVIIYDVYIHIHHETYKKYLIRIVEVTSFILAMIFMAVPSNYDILFILFICIFILSSLWKQSVFAYLGKNWLVKKISRYEYAIFLNHAVIIILLEDYLLNICNLRIMYKLLILLFIVTIYSVITQKLIDFIKKKVF